MSSRREEKIKITEGRVPHTYAEVDDADSDVETAGKSDKNSDRASIRSESTIGGKTYKESDISTWILQLKEANSIFKDYADQLGSAEDNPDLRKKIQKARGACKKEIEKLVFALTSSNRLAQKHKDKLREKINVFEEICHKCEDKERAIIAVMESTNDTERPVPKEEIEKQMKMQKLDSKFIEYDEEEIKKRTNHLFALENDILEVKKMWEDLTLLITTDNDDVDILESTAAKVKFGLIDLDPMAVLIKDAEEKNKTWAKKEEASYTRKKMFWQLMGLVFIVLIIITFVVAFSGEGKDDHTHE